MPPVPPVPDHPADRIRVKRIYRAVRVSDGSRVLVDRLWPRGLAKDRVRLHSWCKEIAPSDELRRWYHANPDAWQEFTARYREELSHKDDLVRELAGLAADGVVTLLYASKEEEHNNAIVLRDYLRQILEKNGKRDGDAEG